MTELNSLQRTTLRNCEKAISKGLETFREVGEALAKIRDEELFVETHSTFKAYCKERWNFSDSRARQLIGGARLAEKVESVTRVTLSSERHVRSLSRLPDAKQAKAWKDAVDSAGGGAPTVKQVDDAVNHILKTQKLNQKSQAAAEKTHPDGESLGVICPVCGADWWYDGACGNCLDPLDETVEAPGEDAGSSEEEPSSRPPRKGKEEPAADYGRCPACAGAKWTTGEDGVSCARCGHPYGEPAGEPDGDSLTTQRQKTVKTGESLMRAFDDLNVMLAKPEHAEAIRSCKALINTAKGWK